MRCGAGTSIAVVISGAIVSTMAVGLAGAVLRTTPPSGLAVSEIPAVYLVAYRAASERFSLGTDGWSFLAAIGKIESDHGRSSAPGVTSGQNGHGCCAGPMQIHNGFGSGGGTWGAFKADGDQNGRVDIYDPDDAAATAAHYLKVSGAPADWRAAIFAYNHAGWYVDDVIRQAAEYRAQSDRPMTVQKVGPLGPGSWLADVPGFPGERCDRRIIADVLRITERYGLTVNDCFGGEPHALNGEHPLGLALDLTPVDGDWNRTLRLSLNAGWSPSCARSGCPGRGPFRVVLYNGFPGHGDPRFTSRPHLHLSWEHGPASRFSPAPWVRVLSPSGASSS